MYKVCKKLHLSKDFCHFMKLIFLNTNFWWGYDFDQSQSNISFFLFHEGCCWRSLAAEHHGLNWKRWDPHWTWFWGGHIWHQKTFISYPWKCQKPSRYMTCRLVRYLFVYSILSKKDLQHTFKECKDINKIDKFWLSEPRKGRRNKVANHKG